MAFRDPSPVQGDITIQSDLFSFVWYITRYLKDSHGFLLLLLLQNANGIIREREEKMKMMPVGDFILETQESLRREMPRATRELCPNVLNNLD